MKTARTPTTYAHRDRAGVFHSTRIVPSTRATALVGRMVTAPARANPARKGGQTDMARDVWASGILGKRGSRARRATARKKIDGPCSQSALDALDQALVANA